jgi:anti-sigma factor RsiW
MSSCTSIESLVTPYVDGELAASDRSLVEEHFRHCAACYSRMAAEAAVRDLVHARRSGLTRECASAKLRAQCQEIVASGHGQAGSSKSKPNAPVFSRIPWRDDRFRRGSQWTRRWAPLALTAALIAVVGGAFLYQATHYSARVLAMELTADHMKCFAANSLMGTHDEPAAVESLMLSAFGWRLRLPQQLTTSGLELVGSRRCLYAEGKIAHLMYREQGRAVSIFMLPERMRPEEFVEVLGHEAVIWSAGGRTFVLVTRGSRAEVEQMAAVAKAALQ